MKRKIKNYVRVDNNGYLLGYVFDDKFIKANLPLCTEANKLYRLVKDDDMYHVNEYELDADEIRYTEKVKKLVGEVLIKLSNKGIAIKDGWNNPYFKEYCEA